MSIHVMEDSIFILVDERGAVVGAETADGSEVPCITSVCLHSVADKIQSADISLACRIRTVSNDGSPSQ